MPRVVILDKPLSIQIIPVHPKMVKNATTFLRVKN